MEQPKVVVRGYVGIFQEWAFVHKASNFGLRMMEGFNLWNMKPLVSENDLMAIEKAAECWIRDYCRLHVQRLNGLLRSTIMVLGERTLTQNELTYNATFNMRQTESIIIEELRLLLRYLWRQTDFPLHEYRSEISSCQRDHDTLVNTCFVPRLLFKVLMEEPKTAISQTIVESYTKHRFFKKSNGGLSVTI